MLKVTPHTISKNSFTSNEKDVNGNDPSMTSKKKYHDPLNNWPVRGLAYSNEIGAAISEVAPKLGAILWWPAMLYFGADIYDKYKNDKMSYDPNGLRGTEQAIFQLLASVVLPTAAVHTGQKAASYAGKMSKEKMTLQTKEEISKFTLDYMRRHKLYKSQDNVEEYKKAYFASLDNYIFDKKNEAKFKNPLKTLYNSLFVHKHPEAMGNIKLDRVHDYAGKKIDEIFALREQLMKNEKPAAFSDKMFRQFKKAQEMYKNNPEFKDNYLSHAAKHILKKYEQSGITRIKMWKTLGGFIALGLMIKPIDMFVEKTIMKKFVKPKLSSFNQQDVKQFKEKALEKQA